MADTHASPEHPQPGAAVHFADPATTAAHAVSGAAAHVAGAEEAAHGGGHGGHGAGAREHIHEVPNLAILLRNGPFLNNPTAREVLETIEVPFYSLIVVIALCWVVRRGTRAMTLVPGRIQNLIEIVVEGFDSFICGIMGEKVGRRHIPFIGSLFIFILFNNLLGLVPLMKSPTSAYQTTLALGLITFCYVQYNAMRMNGAWGYLHHLMGSPRGGLWLLVPLMLPLHILGELIKPVSLSLRLFGNIMGEDILLYVFSLIGVTLVYWLPLQFPFFFLALLTSTIQALVFSLLATVYITLFIPHEEHGEHEAHEAH